MAVNDAPVSCAANPYRSHASQKYEMLHQIKKIETAAVNRRVGRNVLPGNHEKQVQPPHQQKRKIQTADARSGFVSLDVWPHGERRHHGDEVQEQNDITHKWIRNLLP